MKTVDFDRYRPDLLCVETLVFHTTRIDQTIVDFVQSKGYVPRGGSMINTVFVDGRRPKPAS